MNQEKFKPIYNIFKEIYPEARSGLNYNSPFQLLVAVVLSAQCTDKRVNIITEELFKVCNSPQDILLIGQAAFAELVKSCGLYKSKSKNIIETCRILVEKYGGEIPNTREELLKLPGVGRKSANVILIEAFQIPAVPVDTHVFRVSNRIGITKANNTEQTERQFMNAIPENMWIKMHHFIIHHGRTVCSARNPKCKICKINEYCDFTKQH